MWNGERLFRSVFEWKEGILSPRADLAFSMYLFTRGEGPLRTTHDLFAQAEYFASEGSKLHRTVADFTGRIPGGPVRADLSGQLDRLPARCQQLHNCLRQVSLGKAATFAKVDHVIQDVKDTMSLVTKLVTACFICNTKVGRFSSSGEDFGIEEWLLIKDASSNYEFVMNLLL